MLYFFFHCFIVLRIEASALCSKYISHVIIIFVTTVHEQFGSFLSPPFISVGPGSNPTSDLSLACDLVFSPYLIVWVFPDWGFPLTSKTAHFFLFPIYPIIRKKL